MHSGYIYIITNPTYKGYVKIGITTDIKKRLGSYQTSSPRRDYKIEHHIYHPDYRIGEKKMHDKLKMFALSRRNEWFEIDLQIAKNMLDSLLVDEENPIEEIFNKLKNVK